jgi:hypothetical protein
MNKIKLKNGENSLISFLFEKRPENEPANCRYP